MTHWIFSNLLFFFFNTSCIVFEGFGKWPLAHNVYSRQTLTHTNVTQISPALFGTFHCGSSTSGVLRGWRRVLEGRREKRNTWMQQMTGTTPIILEKVKPRPNELGWICIKQSGKRWGRSKGRAHKRSHAHTQRWGGVVLWKHSALRATPCTAAELFPASVSPEDFREKVWTLLVPQPEQLDCSCIAPYFWFQPFLSLCVISCSIFKYFSLMESLCVAVHWALQQLTGHYWTANYSIRSKTCTLAQLETLNHYEVWVQPVVCMGVL